MTDLSGADLEFWTNTQRGMISVTRQRPDGTRVGEAIAPGQEFSISRSDRELTQRATAVPAYDPFTNRSFVQTDGTGVARVPVAQGSVDSVVGARAPFKVDRHASAAVSAGGVLGEPEVTGEPVSPAPVGVVSSKMDTELKALLTERGSVFESGVDALVDGAALVRLEEIAVDVGMSQRKLSVIRRRREVVMAGGVVELPAPEGQGAVAEVPVDAVPPVAVPYSVDDEAEDYRGPRGRRAGGSRPSAPGSEFGEESIYAMGDSGDLGRLAQAGGFAGDEVSKLGE